MFNATPHPRQRAWLIAYAATGSKTEAARRAGVSREIVYSEPWKADAEFQRLLRVAEEMATERLEEEAVRRAIEGVPRYRFHPKTGRPLAHPDLCECGGHRREHERLPDFEDELGRKWPRYGALDRTGCDGFEGRPYVEHEQSDRLLEFLLKGLKQERYGNKVAVTGQLGLYQALAAIPPEAAEELLELDDDELRARLKEAQQAASE